MLSPRQQKQLEKCRRCAHFIKHRMWGYCCELLAESGEQFEIWINSLKWADKCRNFRKRSDAE